MLRRCGSRYPLSGSFATRQDKSLVTLTQVLWQEGAKNDVAQ